MTEKKPRLRIGFVGVGAMGQAAHLRNYASLDECDVVALAEVREDLGRRVAARYGIPQVYRDARSLLANEKLDGLVASQQFSRHGIVVGELLPAGLPIFIEKPLAASLPAAELLAAADRKAGGKLMIGYHKRSDPATICAKAEIDRLKQTGELGKMRYLRVTMPPGDWVAHGFFDTLFESSAPAPADVDPGDPNLDPESEKAYGGFVNFYIHQINLIRHLIGENYRLSYVDPAGVVIVGHGTGSGIPATLEIAPYATASDWQETVLAAFERGYVKLTLPAPLAINRPGEVEIYRDPGAGAVPPPPYPIRFKHSAPWLGPGSNWSAASTTIPKLPADHAMRVQAANFLRFVRGEAPPPCGSAEALEDLKIARAWLKLAKGVEMPLKFRKVLIAAETFESAGAWDVDGDGVLDIVSGSFWHKGPDFRQRFFIGDVSRAGEYWNDFSTLPLAIAGSGRLDFVTGGWGGDFRWVECPPDPTQPWTRHPLPDIGPIETTRACDLDGDGVLEIIPHTPGNSLQVLKLVPGAGGRGAGKFSQHVLKEGPSGHGLGFGDINGDGRVDIVLADGWLEAPERPWERRWKFHREFDLGCASIPILVADVNGDGLNDLIVGQAHGYGLDWYEQRRRADGAREWIKHPIDPFNSQYHDMRWQDIDGDGRPELVTGKRYRAHCGRDPGEFDDLGIYYFKWTGEGFAKQVIDFGPPGAGAGCGIHFALADLRGTGRIDVIAPGKDGLHVFFNEGNA